MKDSLQTKNPSFVNPTAVSTEFDTGIPFISGNIIVAYSILPQLYIVGSLIISFIFEQPFDLRILLDFFWIWLYLRFFMKTNDGQVGDLTQEFALSTFFPQRLSKPVQVMSELCFAFFNMCGFVNCVRNYLSRAPY